MVGKILVYIFFSTALLLPVSVIISLISVRKNFLSFGRLFYHLTAVGVLSTAAYLMYLIFTHQFQFAYVWEQSSTDLQIPLLMSTFYSGQEGSFMLWTTMTAIIGIFLLNYVSKGDRLEPQVMSVFTLIIAFPRININSEISIPIRGWENLPARLKLVLCLQKAEV
ncbi:MAG: hypothetical protein R3A12_15075 [Ignavibacteria bacterium]